MDALGIKFEDLLNLYGEHNHGRFPYSLERPIASHCGEAESAGALPLDVRSADCAFHFCRLLLSTVAGPYPPPKSHQIAIDLIEVVVRVLVYHGKRGGTDIW